MKAQLDDSKVTLRWHKGRLCIWPDNTIRWIERNDADELVVDKMPAPTRLEWGTAEKVLRDMAENPTTRNFAQALRDGMAVVMRKAELPKFATMLV
jgi:hypothetical protein